jgi:hypothetical protein
MIVQLIAQYRSTGRDDAVAQAEEAWRTFMGDAKATLPWAATLNVQVETTGDPQPYLVDLLVKDNKAEGSVLTSGG